MPGIFGLEDELAPAAAEVASHAPSHVNGPAAAAAEEAVVKRALSSLEEEKSKLQRKELQLERQVAAILQSVQKLSDLSAS